MPDLTCVRLSNGFAGLGCMIAYATPVRIRLAPGSLVLDVQGGKLKLSRLKAIEHRNGGYGMPSYHSLTLDDGATLDADDAVRAGD